MSYRNLDVWKIAREVSIAIHQMTLTELLKFETYEAGSQIRRSSKSVRSNIVEGYGRKKYQAEFVKHLVYAPGSNDETIDHLETLFETGSLKNKILFEDLLQQLHLLGKKLNLLIQSIEQSIIAQKRKQDLSLQKEIKLPVARSQKQHHINNTSDERFEQRIQALQLGD